MMSEDNLPNRVALLALIVFVLLIFATSVNWSTRPAIEAVRNGNAATVWEFWFYRHQGLIGTTLVAASVSISGLTLLASRRKNRADILRGQIQAMSELIDQINAIEDIALEILIGDSLKKSLTSMTTGQLGNLLQKRKRKRDNLSQAVLKARLSLIRHSVPQAVFLAVTHYLGCVHVASKIIDDVEDFVRRQSVSGVHDTALPRSVDAYLLQHNGGIDGMRDAEALWDFASSTLVRSIEASWPQRDRFEN